MLSKLSLELPENLASVGLARRICSTLLTELRVASADIADTALILSELCTNAVLHGTSPERQFHVELTCFGTMIRVIVTDTGRGFSLEELDVPLLNSSALELLAVDLSNPIWTETLLAGEPRFGGMGIYSVQSLTRYVTFERLTPRGMKVTAVRDVAYLTEGEPNVQQF